MTKSVQPSKTLDILAKQRYECSTKTCHIRDLCNTYYCITSRTVAIFMRFSTATSKPALGAPTPPVPAPPVSNTATEPTKTNPHYSLYIFVTYVLRKLPTTYVHCQKTLFHGLLYMSFLKVEVTYKVKVRLTELQCNSCSFCYTLTIRE